LRCSLPVEIDRRVHCILPLQGKFFFESKNNRGGEKKKSKKNRKGDKQKERKNVIEKPTGESRVNRWGKRGGLGKKHVATIKVRRCERKPQSAGRLGGGGEGRR